MATSLSLLALRQVPFNIRCRPLQLSFQLKELRGPIRFASKKARSPPSPPKPYIKPYINPNTKPGGLRRGTFPEKLLIYHAGTTPITYLACANITSIFAFALFCGFLAPKLYADNEVTMWVTSTVFLSGLIPPIVTMYASRPFVCYIHLHLPTYARISREMMLRYAKTPPKEAVLDITTIKSFGFKRINQVRISELYPIKSILANCGRDTIPINAMRSWWMPRAIGRFNVHRKETKSIVGGEAWPLISATIAKRAVKV